MLPARLDFDNQSSRCFSQIVVLTTMTLWTEAGRRRLRLRLKYPKYPRNLEKPPAVPDDPVLLVLPRQVRRVFFKKSKFKNSPLIGHYEWIEPFEACCNTQNVTLLICVLIWLHVLFHVWNESVVCCFAPYCNCPLWDK